MKEIPLYLYYTLSNELFFTFERPRQQTVVVAGVEISTGPPANGW